MPPNILKYAINDPMAFISTRELMTKTEGLPIRRNPIS